MSELKTLVEAERSKRIVGDRGTKSRRQSRFDSYLYQLAENKRKFIAQIMTSKTPLRAAGDVDKTALSYSEIKALATEYRMAMKGTLSHTIVLGAAVYGN